MEFLEAIWEDSSSGMFVARCDGSLIRTNKAFGEIFSGSEEEINSNGLKFCLGSSEQYVEFISILNEKKIVKNFLAETKTKSGSLVFYKMSARLHGDVSDHQTIIGSIINLTELSAARRAQMESQRTYQDLFENSLEIIQSFDSTGRLLFCNKAWHEKLEYSEDDLSKITLFDIIAEEHRTHCAGIFMEVLQGKSFTNMEVDFVSKSGRIISVEGNIVPLLRNGKLIATHGFFRDVTEKNKALALASAQKRLVETIFDSLPVCMYVKDLSGQYAYGNVIMDQTLGKKVSGCYDADLYPPDLLPVLQKTDNEAVGRPEELVTFNITLQSPKRDRHFLCGKKFMPGVDGQAQIFGYGIDMTELIHNTHRVERNEQMLQFIIDNISEGLLLYRKNFRDRYVRIFRNKKITEIISDNEITEDLEATLNFLDVKIKDLQRFFVSGNYESEVNLNRQDGEQVILSLRAHEFKATGGESQLLISLYDNTKEKAMLHEIERKYEENLVLMGEIHHRVKNNLAIIDGIFELKKAQVSDVNSKQLISEMQLRVKSIALVHQKLYNAIDFSTIPFNDYIMEMASYYKKLYSTDSYTDVSFDYRIDKSICLDISRSISLGLLISELVSNSLKYGTVDGKVRILIELAYFEGEMRLVYEDTGPGMPKNMDESRPGGFGFKLMDSLQKQLKGVATIQNTKNFCYILTFPIGNNYVKKADSHR